MVKLLSSDKVVLSHYEHYWAKSPLGFHEFSTPLSKPFDSITVAVWKPEKPEQDWIFSTIGVHKLPMPSFTDLKGKKQERRIELFLHVNENVSELAHFLIDLATYPFKKNTFLSSGHTIMYENDYVPGSTMNSVLFVYPYFEPKGFQSLHYNNQHVWILWAIPIYESERQYKMQYGYKALLDLFSENAADTSELTRTSVV